ncbi:hypothetical protein [Microbacterium sp. XT11]|uniref:hypothetical protein n=1 Tax=Microbacterium sp. XT11 TaxID=367477 RepID=UPI00082A814E|nr:hypothetical protein [Microbacterium sp. XT11]
MSVLLDEETVVLEGLDFEVPCLTGGHAAQLSIACRTCQDQAFYCTDHWARKRREIEEFLSTSILSMVACASCKTVAYTVDDLVTVVPL